LWQVIDASPIAKLRLEKKPLKQGGGVSRAISMVGKGVIRRVVKIEEKTGALEGGTVLIL